MPSPALMPGRSPPGFWGLAEEDYGSSRYPVLSVRPASVAGLAIPFPCPRCGEVTPALVDPACDKHYLDPRTGGRWCPACGQRLRVLPPVPLAEQLAAGAQGASAEVVIGASAPSDAVAYLKTLVGTPYVWGSKDPKVGLDCSGAVTVAYEHVGLARPGARYRYGSADLARKLAPTSSPSPGDLVFYGRDGKVTHVMMYAGDGQVIGATGGGRSTKTADDARAIGAYVKMRPVDYRKDIIGYGRAPTTPLDGSSSTRVSNSDTESDFPLVPVLLAAAAALLGLTAWRSHP